jgi:nitrogen fixation/metabolism regulation signal transduction histidine kinase
MEAVKKSFDKTAIMNNVLKNQVAGLRAEIKYLDDAHHLKKIAPSEYYGAKRKLLVEILDNGGTLCEEERNWLELNHFDKSKGNIS